MNAKLEFQAPNRWHRAVKRVASMGPVTAVLRHLVPRLDRTVLRMTSGRHSLTQWLSGVPVVNLATIGSKSGRPRSTPLLGIPDGDNLILIASNWGQRHHPAWYHNLCAHPRCSVTYGNKTVAYLAHIAEGDERRRCWQKAVEVYAGFTAYQSRTRGRTVPVVVLTPVFSA